MNNATEVVTEMPATSSQQASKHNARAEKKKADRAYVMEFVDANTKLGVRVQRTEAFRPYYALVVGRYVEHEKGESFVPYLPVRGDVELAKVKSVQDNSKIVASLISDATEWVRAKLQEREDEIIMIQQEREQRQMNRDAPAARPGLKTLSKIDRIHRAYEK